MRNLLRITLILFCANAFAQNIKQELIRESLKSKRDSLLLITISDIVKSINTQDNNFINKYVDPQIGIFSFRNSYAKYDFIKKINFSDTILNSLPEKILNLKVIFENVSEYNCKNRKWKTIGILVDTINVYKPFSEIVRNQNRDQDSDFGISIMENNSRRIIVSQKNGNSFTLYLGFYRENWWITFLDFRKIECKDN